MEEWELAGYQIDYLLIVSNDLKTLLSPDEAANNNSVLVLILSSFSANIRPRALLIALTICKLYK